MYYSKGEGKVALVHVLFKRRGEGSLGPCIILEKRGRLVRYIYYSRGEGKVALVHVLF